VIVIAVTGEHLPRHRAERLERREEQVGIAMRLHREEVAGEEHQIGLGGHARSAMRRRRATDMTPDVRVGDLDDAERTLLAALP